MLHHKWLDELPPTNTALDFTNRRQARRRISPRLGLRQLLPRLVLTDFPAVVARTTNHQRKQLAQGIVELLNEGDRRRALRGDKWT